MPTNYANNYRRKTGSMQEFLCSKSVSFAVVCSLCFLQLHRLLRVTSHGRGQVVYLHNASMTRLWAWYL